ncbi:MAG: hypothetical protein ABIR68_19095 [Ilumatobacteraceae bacterium]
MTDTIDTSNVDVPEQVSGSRRALLGKGAMAAAVAATAGLAVSRNASAADTDPVAIGNATNVSSGTTDTGLTGGSTLIVTDGKTSGSGTGPTLIKASVVGKQSQTGSAGIVGSNSGAGGWGLWGEDTSPVSATAVGTGVIGASNNGNGVVGAGKLADFVAGGSGLLILNKDAFAGAAPTTAAAIVGSLARDAGGNLWYSPTTGTWVKVAGPTGGAGAGTLHVIAPVRVYDSRLVLPATPAKLAFKENRVVSIADARNETTGAVTTANVVPAGATAVVANLTITETEGDLGGFLSVVPGDATALSGSSINWSGPNQNIANGLTAKISADRKLNVFCGGVPTSKTHFVIDISGYYL